MSNPKISNYGPIYGTSYYPTGPITGSGIGYFTSSYTVPIGRPVGSKNIPLPAPEPLRFSLDYAKGSFRGPEPPVYCRKCSAILDRKTKIIEYDSATCEPVYKSVIVQCPYYNLWDSILGRKSHDKAEQDKHKDWVWL